MIFEIDGLSLDKGEQIVLKYMDQQVNPDTPLDLPGIRVELHRDVRHLENPPDKWISGAVVVSGRMITDSANPTEVVKCTIDNLRRQLDEHIAAGG